MNKRTDLSNTFGEIGIGILAWVLVCGDRSGPVAAHTQRTGGGEPSCHARGVVPAIQCNVKAGGYEWRYGGG